MVLRLNRNRFILKGRPFFIFSGEIHYFRILPDLWPCFLEKAKQAGLNTVSTYIPWCWHEEKENEFDFSGRTHLQKNLIKFLEEVKRKNLYLILRIGPVSNAELKNEGIPGWLFKKHPEILTKGKGTENLPHTTLISYLNPDFLKFVKKWYYEVFQIIEEFKNITLLVQVDNEIGMSHWVNKTPDMSKQATILYQNFLRITYKKIDRLNKVYGTAWKNFNQIQQPLVKNDFKILFDWGLFYRNYFSEYFKFLKDLFREKFNLPILINIPQFCDYDIRGRGFYSPTTTSFYRDFRRHEKNITFGGAYQLRRIDYENFHDIFITTEAIRMINPKNPNICAELQTGIMRDKPRLYASDVELHLKTSLVSGLKGINCYMFAGGENPENLGVFGKFHDWQSPVGHDLKIKPHFEVIESFGTFLKTWGEYFAKTEKVNFINFAFYLPYWIGEFSDWKQLEYARNRYFFDGIGRIMILCGYQFGMVDLLEENLDKFKSFLIFSWKWMDLKTQNKILNYVRGGGKVLLGPWLPEGIAKKLKIRKKEVKTNIAIVDKKECYFEGNIESYECKKFDEVLARDKKGNVLAFIKKEGKGEILAYGFPFVHYFDYQIDILRNWMKRLGLKLPFEIEPEDISVVLNKGKNYSFISVSNYHDFFCEAKLKFGKLNLKIDLFPHQSKILPVNLKLENLKINYASSEIIETNGEKFLVRGKVGESGEIEIEKNGTKLVRKFKLKKEKMWIDFGEM